MTPDQWTTIARLRGWIDVNNGCGPHEITLRTTSKLSEELGEFAEAVEAGLWGESLAELVDVQLTAGVALASIAKDTERLYREHTASRDAMAAPPWSPLQTVAALAKAIGKVSQARIGTIGQNPRKGTTHTTEDIATELCAVIRIAETSMQWFTDAPRKEFDDRLRTVAERVLPHTEAEAV